jgi:hypothetical protein
MTAAAVLHEKRFERFAGVVASGGHADERDEQEQQQRAKACAGSSHVRTQFDRRIPGDRSRSSRLEQFPTWIDARVEHRQFFRRRFERYGVGATDCAVSYGSSL